MDTYHKVDTKTIIPANMYLLVCDISPPGYYCTNGACVRVQEVNAKCLGTAMAPRLHA